MMKYEFEQIAGYEVSFDDYNNIIEPMYIATNLSKTEFVKCINKKQFALKPLSTIIKDMKKCANQLKDSCTHYTDYEIKEKLNALASEYTKRKYDKYASWGATVEKIQSCYYIKSIEIFDATTFKMIEKIELV